MAPFLVAALVVFVLAAAAFAHFNKRAQYAKYSGFHNTSATQRRFMYVQAQSLLSSMRAHYEVAELSLFSHKTDGNLLLANVQARLIKINGHGRELVNAFLVLGPGAAQIVPAEKILASNGEGVLIKSSFAEFARYLDK